MCCYRSTCGPMRGPRHVSKVFGFVLWRSSIELLSPTSLPNTNWGLRMKESSAFLHLYERNSSRKHNAYVITVITHSQVGMSHRAPHACNAASHVLSAFRKRRAVLAKSTYLTQTLCWRRHAQYALLSARLRCAGPAMLHARMATMRWLWKNSH